MNPTYQEKSIYCLKCNAYLLKVVVKPDKFEIRVADADEHKHIVEIDRKSGEIKTLIEEN